MGGTVGAGGYSTPSRPLGVGILAVLIGIFGVLWIIGGVILLATGAAFAYFDQGSLLGLAGLSGVIAGAIVLVIGLIILGIALG
ncbi:MAG TPA: hypothetical protein VLX64_02495, partial [Thermoplasmata archaeon]|nr:hypothetical protein [Thermoplasmata archaeon]